MAYSGITLRTIRPEDEDFLYRVYASTRLDELVPLNWDQDQVDAFLQMQFTAQHKYYQEYFTDASFNIILLDNQRIGRLYLDRREDEIRIIDIALLPEYRNAGIGSALLKDILAEATAAGKVVRIHVEKINPALRLYKRLGFYQINDTGVYFLMEWSPDPHNLGN